MKNCMDKKWLHGKFIPILVEAVLTVICLNLIWYTDQPKFHDLTVELGAETVTLSDFATKYADPRKLRFVSDPGAVDLNRVGTTEITLAHGWEKETVTLTVADTQAPEVTFVEEILQRIDSLPAAEDFVADISDESKTKVYFASDVVIPKDYADITVRVIVEDACGNITQQDCLVKYQWIEETYTLEYGEQLTLEDILLDPVRDAVLIDQAEIDAVNAGAVGSYTVTGRVAGRNSVCRVAVVDTTGPELTVKNLRVNRGGRAELKSFVKSATDLSGVKEVRLVTEVDTSDYGKFTVTIEAEDNCGNITSQEATLWVAAESVPPVIKGAKKTLTVAKHSEVDLLQGVTANDKKDGVCQVVCDSSKLDLDTAGTYYVTYSAWDNSGNKATVKRKVIVEHDEEDTAALVASIAEKLSDDPEKIRDYVRSHIYYNHDWGDNDPVWYGFTKHVGNCYVHAMCLKAIFDLKGIESQLIWVTAKSHYWLIVNIDGTWKHIDPTPSRIHGRYSLMNDAQRLSTLSGRKWDTSLWPACE